MNHARFNAEAETAPGPGEGPGPRLGQVLERLEKDSRRLLESVPAIWRRLHPKDGEGADPGPAWERFAARCRDIVLWKYPVAAFFGPSGAGKSTFFQDLTGLEVPTSPAIRPTTFASLAALPAGLGAAEVERMFPGFSVRELPPAGPELRAGLTRRDLPRDTLFHTHPPDRDLPYLLVDVPDFNTVEEANREKAEAIAQRAEVVVFLVYKEGYADRQTVDQLLFCCRRAAQLVFILTKTTAPEARVIWEDLLAKLASRPDFQAPRRDGETALSFLRRAAVFHSPPAAGPGGAEALPLTQGGPGLLECLASRSPGELQINQIYLALNDGRDTAAAALADLAQAREGLRLLEQNTRSSVERETREGYRLEFPIGQMLVTLSNQAHARLKDSGWFSRALYYINYPGRKATQRFRQRLSRKQEDLAKLKDAEAESLAAMATALADRWRLLAGRDPETMARLPGLGEERVSRALENLSAVALPPAPPEWETSLEEICDRWLDSHPNEARNLALLGGTLAGVMSGVFVTVDVMLGGPLVSAFISGPVGAALGQLLGQLIEDYKLEQAVREAFDRWRQERSRQLTGHILEHFAGPLFLDRLMEKRAALAALPAGEVEEVLRSMDADLALLLPYARPVGGPGGRP